MRTAASMSAIAFFLCSSVLAVDAAQLDISGRVVDKVGSPVAGVGVDLAQAGVSTDTDNEGRFVFSGEAGVLSPSKEAGRAFSVQGSRILLPKLKENTSLRFTALTLQGRTVVDLRVPAGPGTPRLFDPFMLLGERSAPQVLLLSLLLGSHRAEFAGSAQPRWLRAVSSSCIASTRRLSASSPACVDTLILTHDGFLRKKVLVTSCTADVGDVFLYESTVDFTSATYPSVDGSTSAQPLALVVAATILGTSYGFSENFDGSRSMVAYSSSKPALADSLNSVIIRHHGTHGAHVNVIEGKAELALVARSPSPDETQLADSLGVSVRVEPVALDAFVFINNVRNPVDSVTIDQVRKIYTGTVTNWEALGGPSLAIKPYQRERNSGSQELMQSLVMGELVPIDAPDMIVPTMMGPYNALQTDTSGICYTVYFYGRHMAPAENVKFMVLDGVFPEYQTIASRTYPLSTEVYLVTRADLDPSTNAAHLRDWLLAPEGQEVVKASGYVPIDESGF